MFVVSQSYPQRLPSDDRTLGFDLTVRAAYVVILAITGAIWCLIVLGMRTYLRIFINGPFGWDDYACMAATLFACISATLTLMQVHFGLGEHVHSLDAHAQDMIHIMSYINAMAYLLALTFSILSICMLIERITSSTKQALLSCIVGIMTCGWAITTIFVVAFQCPLPRPWLQGAGAGCMNTVCRGPRSESQTCFAHIFSLASGSCGKGSPSRKLCLNSQTRWRRSYWCGH